METLTNLILVHSFFPLSNQEGCSTQGVNKQRITNLAKNSKPLSKSKLEIILEKHFDFLSGGGAGGAWQTLLVNGLVLGFYENYFEVKEGEQAVFERMNLNKIELVNKELPFANFCGAFKEKGDFRNSNLSHCLFTDSFLKKVNFQNANLQNSDFSRANLRGANFQNANLQGVDFENCDLKETDFRNTNLKNTRFPGANLEGVLHSFKT